jgi:hypothetical protein
MDRRKLARVHILKKELGLADSEYRDLLRRVGGVDTSKDLDAFGYQNVIQRMEAERRRREEANRLTEKQLRYIHRLERQLGWGDEHLENFLSRYYHKRTDQLTRTEGSHAIESLKHVLKHRRAHIGRQS